MQYAKLPSDKTLCSTQPWDSEVNVNCQNEESKFLVIGTGDFPGPDPPSSLSSQLVKALLWDTHDFFSEIPSQTLYHYFQSQTAKIWQMHQCWWVLEWLQFLLGLLLTGYR